MMVASTGAGPLSTPIVRGACTGAGGSTIEDGAATASSGDPALAEAAGAGMRAVFDAAPRPLLVLAADPPRFTMLAVNPAHARAFATTPDALVGHGA